MPSSEVITTSNRARKCSSRAQSMASSTKLSSGWMPYLLLIIIMLQYPLIVIAFGTRSHFRLICYYNAVEAWRGRKSKGIFLPKDIEPEKCTHIHYGYGSVDSETFLIKSADEWAELDNKLYKNVMDLRKKNQQLRILLSLGGWSEDSQTMSRLVADPRRRKGFIVDAIRFLKLHDFDGLDIAWFFPVCWAGDCNDPTSGNKMDKKNFGLFLRELREAFDRQEPRLMLTGTGPNDPAIANKAYDISALAILDYFNVMTFDYNPDWLGRTGHHAPLYAYTQNDKGANANETMHFYASNGVPKEKLIMGIPTYGRTHTLANRRTNGLGAPVIGPGIEGEYTRIEGLLASYEVCDRIAKKGWTKKEQPEGVPYAYLDNQWMSYDNDDTAALKASFIMENGFGGAMIWDIDRDDFRGICSSSKYPILTAVANKFYGQGMIAHYPDFRSDRFNKLIGS